MNWEAISAIGELVSAIAVLMTLVYLAVQVKHSKTLLECNQKIALSQVHQARADIRVNQHLTQFSSPFYTQAISNLWRNPDGVDQLSEEEYPHARAAFMTALVIQDNALFQGELGLLDADTLNASKEIVVVNYSVWKRLGIEVTPRIQRCYENHQLSSEKDAQENSDAE